jgi:hypothetical protein
MTMMWSSRAIGAVVAIAALSVSDPALACSCAPPDTIEVAGRAALARADLAAEVEIGRIATVAPPRFWCGSDGRARPWFRPGRQIEQSRPARVVRTIKGSVSSPIRILGNPVENTGGTCGTQMNSCQVSLGPDAGRTGPLLFRRVAPGTFEPLDVCTQAAFTTWYEQRRSRRASLRTPR